jgi:hypothetical protein
VFELRINIHRFQKTCQRTEKTPAIFLYFPSLTVRSVPYPHTRSPYPHIPPHLINKKALVQRGHRVMAVMPMYRHYDEVRPCVFPKSVYTLFANTRLFYFPNLADCLPIQD